MKFRNTLIIFALLLIVVLTYVLLTRHVPRTDQAREQSNRIWAGPEFVRRRNGETIGLARLVTRLEIRKGPRIIALQKESDDEDNWRITTPMTLRADEGKVITLLFALEWMLKKDTIRPEQGQTLDLKRYGLDNPKTEATIAIHDRQWTLHVGNKTEIGNNVYVRRTDEDAVHVVGSGVIACLDKSVIELCRTPPLASATKLIIERDRGTYVCQKQNNEWKLISPVVSAANQFAVEDAVLALAALQTEPFETSAPKSLRLCGLDQPALKATLEYEEPATPDASPIDSARRRKRVVARTLLIGNPAREGTRWAKMADSDLIFRVASSVFENLKAEMASLKVMAFAKDDVSAIVLHYAQTQEAAAKTVRYERTGETWILKKPGESPARKSEIQDILNTLHDLHARKIEAYQAADLARCGLDAPRFMVSIEMSGSRRQALKVGKAESDDLFYVSGSAAPFVYLVPKHDLDRTMKRPPHKREYPPAPPR